ncbi:T-cell surface glycoprotein CD8 alpha chain [Suncus etruscus]|uniref:T-cell surface glycoprotein CD8 alpha chain n=1 Tax=Suncus etruscus TaxID=109475 RepID=UPI0021106B45|nr:T-cell surface glycoprotein CD8 alpha chain [Suncus etruscus]
MARSALAGLLPLFLLFYSANTASCEPIQLGMSQKGSALPKEQVQLRCEVLRSEPVTGCNWLFQGPDLGAVPEFLVYIGTRSVLRPGLSGVSGKKESPGVFVLTLDSFGESQQGYYFCAVISNSIMHFSSRLPLFLPAKPTTTPRPPTRAPNTPQPLSSSPETCRPASRLSGDLGKGRWDTQGLDLSCNIYIWAPLAGVCAILLFSLFAILVCIRRNRRRVCKCPRPQVRLGGKSSPSERYV